MKIEDDGDFQILDFGSILADEDKQNDKMALTALLVVILVRKIRRRSGRRKTWDREWILRSQQQGAYPNLLR